jgi:hypothetical protein
MGDMEMQVTLKLRDQMSAESAKVLDALRQGVSAGTAAFVQSARASRDSGRAAVEAGKAGQNAAAQATAAVQRQTAATERAGKATRDLARDTAEAKARAEEMAKAWTDLGHKERNVLGLVGRIRQVDQYARRAEQGLLGAARAAGRMGQAVVQGGAAIAAGGYVAGRALAKPVDYERRLAQMANTAYAEEGVAGRRAGMGQLRGAVDAAVDQGGGTREAAAEALDKMLASGAIKTDEAMRLLPTLQKFATASGASSGELADIAIRGIQQGFFKPGQAGTALDKAMVAGQMGGFELKDMARWLPQMMANAAGMKSMGGFERILASAQASAITAGSKDQAGNNLVNLLAKLNSQDTAQDFKKLGIDLSGTLAAAREKGTLPLDAFVQLIDQKVVGKDKRFQALKARAATAQGGEKAQAVNDMADILQASAIGKVVQDRQAMLALVAEMTQRGYIKDVLGGMGKAEGAGQTSFAVIAGTASYKLERAQNAKDMAASGMLDKVGGPLGNVASAAAAVAREFPGLATASFAAATAISALAASAGVLAAGRMLFGGGAAAGAAGAAGSAAAAGANASRLGRAWAGAKSGWGGAAGRWAGRAGGLFAVAGTALDIYGTETDQNLSRAQKNAAHTGTALGAAGGWGGAVLGAKAGAAVGGGVGALFGGVGAAPGAAIGGFIGGIGGGIGGWWGGKSLGDKAGDVLFGGGGQKTIIESKLILDGREVAAVVNEVNARQAQRH